MSLVGPLLLAIALAVGAWLTVPCHWIPVALDPEFTGWVAPIAARFSDGMRLYADGGHSPLPPLSFAATYVAGLGHPIWWHESALNAGCQALAVVAIYAAACRFVPAPGPLVVALGTYPLFLGIGKSLLYDSLAQAGVALLGLAMLHWWDDRRNGTLTLAAWAGAVALLAKHNTGGAALLGAGLVTLVAARDVRASAALVGATIASVTLLLMSMLPLVDLGGLVTDVLRYGSEPKGGTSMLREHIVAYAGELAAWPAEPLTLRVGLYGALAAMGCALAAVGPRRLQRLGVLTLVWFPAAVAHCLSGASFRWTYDNNPLIGAVALVLTVAAMARHRLAGAAVVALALAYAAAPGLSRTLEHMASCTEPWPNIAARSGARMAPRAAPFRALADEVQALTASTDAVLMLPEDPDVLATFGRPRPRLTSAILYVDQYWDRFVDEDLTRLLADPPAVIVMAPNGMRFAQTFFGGTDVRVHRLMVRVERELLPQYRLIGDRHFTRMDGRDDFVRIYAHTVTASASSAGPH